MATVIARKLKRLRVRGRIIFACLILVMAPLIVAWSMGIYDRFEVKRVRAGLERTAEVLAREVEERGPHALGEGQDTGWLDAFGTEHGILIRVLDSNGEVVASTDTKFAEGRISQQWWFRRMADFWFGPEGPPDLIAFEAELGPESSREEVRAVLEDGHPAELVRHPDRGDMVVVYRAVPANDRVLYLTRVSRRSIRALYDLRFQLMKLTLGLLLGGLVMGAWLAYSVVNPLIALERRVRRAIASGSPEPLALEREDEIGDLSRNFDALASRLAERAERTSHLAADFAHDLKNPIAAVRAAAEMLESGVALDEERRKRLAKATHEASLHMGRSVDAMLELARLDEALDREAREDFELADLAERNVEKHRADPRADRLTIELAVEGRAKICGNPARISQLLDNLIDNAFVFAKTKISVRIAGTTIEVSDDGPGVSPGNRDKIFQRFFTARPTGAEAGSGLGLSIVEHIAQAHGGTVSLDGAVFRVQLPASTAAA